MICAQFVTSMRLQKNVSTAAGSCATNVFGRLDHSVKNALRNDDLCCFFVFFIFIIV